MRATIPSCARMMNTAGAVPSFEGTLAKEKGCCSYLNEATEGIEMSLKSVYRIVEMQRLTHVALDPIEVMVEEQRGERYL